MRRLPPASPEASESETRRHARALALSRLSVRDHSVRELVGYLTRKRFPESIAVETVETLVKERLLDERRLARSMIRSQATRGKGSECIHAKLRQQGVKIELSDVRSLFGEAAGHDELETARQVVAKRYPRALENERELKRAYAALRRRGFASDVARQALGNPPALDGADADEGY